MNKRNNYRTKWMFFLALSVCMGLLFSFGTGVAKAAEPPAVAAASGPEKARLKELIAGAKKEGSFLWASHTIYSDVGKQLNKAFQKRYGLEDVKVTYAHMKTRALIGRVTQELKANKLAVDVVVAAAVSWFYDMLKNGDLMKYDSPEYKYYGPAEKLGLNEPGYWVADGQSYTIVWNPRIIKDANVRHFIDLLNPRFKGLVMVGDGEKSTTYSTQYFALRKILPLSFFKELAEYGATPVFGGERQSRAIVSGEHPIGYTIMGRHVVKYHKLGQRLEIAYPSEGIPILPCIAAILKKAPHTNAAKLFIDFYRSEEGQMILYEFNPQHSGRAGLSHVKDAELDKVIRLAVPPLEEISTIPIDWRTVTSEDIEKARKEWISVFATGKKK